MPTSQSKRTQYTIKQIYSSSDNKMKFGGASFFGRDANEPPLAHSSVSTSLDIKHSYPSYENKMKFAGVSSLWKRCTGTTMLDLLTVGQKAHMQRYRHPRAKLQDVASCTEPESLNTLNGKQEYTIYCSNQINHIRLTRRRCSLQVSFHLWKRCASTATMLDLLTVGRKRRQRCRHPKAKLRDMASCT